MHPFLTPFHRQLFVYSLAICAFALPLSIFLISVSQIILIVNWLTEAPFSQRWARFKATKALWFISLIYLVHLTGLINTSNFTLAIIDLRIKLPILIIPLIIGTSTEINPKELKKILLFFIIGVFCSTVYSAGQIYMAQGDMLTHMRTISPFVWHTRLAVMTVLALAFVPWLFLCAENRHTKIGYVLLSIWFLFFIYIFQSFTGIVILAILIAGAGGYAIFTSKSLMVKWAIVVFGLTFIIITMSWLLKFYVKNFSPRPINYAKLETISPSGNAYLHDTSSYWLENGNYVNLYVCNTELTNEWGKRSSLQLDSFDRNLIIPRYTLVRYLTSLGLRKDSTGIANLTTEDIYNVENGIANPKYLNKTGISSRLYRIMWEFYHYKHGANPTGYSIPQRIEYLKTAFRAIEKNFWWGTGTGDMEDALQNQYNLDNSPLAIEWRLRAHNQFVTFLLTFGIIQFMLILAAFFIPPLMLNKYQNYLFMVSLAIFILSMLSNDTLEKHTGVSMVALFYALFLFFPNKPTGILPE